MISVIISQMRNWQFSSNKEVTPQGGTIMHRNMCNKEETEWDVIL